MSEFLRCPKCGSESITSDHAERDYDVVWFETYCNQCNFEWIENYEHISNTDREGNEIKDETDFEDEEDQLELTQRPLMIGKWGDFPWGSSLIE